MFQYMPKYKNSMSTYFCEVTQFKNDFQAGFFYQKSPKTKWKEFFTKKFPSLDLFTIQYR